MTRTEAINRVSQHLHSGEFLAELGRRVAYPTESQDAGRHEVLRAYLDERRVARFKIPEQVELRTSLPRNSAGKVLKHKLREELSIQLRLRTPDDTLH